MKKSKIALAAFTAAVLATSSAGLIACSKNTPSASQKGVYEITFDANGGEFSGGAHQVKLKTKNGILKEFPSNPTKSDDSTFMGWTLTFGSSETFSLSHEFTAAKTVYAVWQSSSGGGGGGGGEENTYTITVDPNGGTLVGGSTVTTGTDGKLSALPAAPTKGTDTFDGWFTLQSGGSQVTTSTVFTSDGTIWAHWTPAGQQPTEYTITLDANGGTLSGGLTTSSVQTSGGVLTSLPTPTRSGHTFDGWWTAATGGTEVTTTTPFTDNDTIYAHWTEDQPITKLHTVTINGTEYDLTDNAEESSKWVDGRDREYYKMGASVNSGNTLSFKIDGAPVSFFVETNCKGIDKSITSDPVPSVAVIKDCTLDMYLKHYPANNGKAACWSLYTDDGSTDPDPDIPGTHTATATVGGETKTATVTKHTASQANGFMDVEVSLPNVQVAEGTNVSFKYDDTAVSFGWYSGDSPAVTATLTGGVTTSVTTLATGKYSFYLKHYTEQNEDGEHWYIVAQIDVRQTGLTTATALTANDWYLTGDMTGFGNLYAEYMMTKETDQYKIEVDLPAFTTLKLINGDKSVWVGGNSYDHSDGENWIISSDLITDGYLLKGDNLSVLKAGKYGFYFKNDTHNIYVSRITGDPTPPDPTPQSATVNGKAMTKNEEPDDPNIATEYMLLGETFAANTTLAFVVGSDPVTVGSIGTSTDITLTGGTVKTGSKAGKYNIYLKHKKDGTWEVYGTRLIDPSEITRPADSVSVGNAYLVGKFDSSDASWDNWKTKGFKMTGSGDVYEIEMVLSTEDDFQFIKRVAADADAAGGTIWVNSFATAGISEYITLNNGHVQVRKNGTYKFSVDFAAKKVTLLKTPDGDFVVDPDVVPDNGIKLTFSDNVTITITFDTPTWATSKAKLHMWGNTSVTGFPIEINGNTETLSFASTAVTGYQIQFLGDETPTAKMKYSVDLTPAFTDGATYNYSIKDWNTGVDSKFNVNVA